MLFYLFSLETSISLTPSHAKAPQTKKIRVYAIFPLNFHHFVVDLVRSFSPAKLHLEGNSPSRFPLRGNSPSPKFPDGEIRPPDGGKSTAKK